MSNKIEEALKGITPERLDAMTLNERLRVQELTEELKIRKRDFPIIDFELQDHQLEIEDAIAKRKPDWTPFYKFIIMIGGNWWGKTIVGAYITSEKVLGKDGVEKYWLRDLGHAVKAKIVTSTWNQIVENLEPYILWTDVEDGVLVQDLLKIPPEAIKKNWIRKEKDVLKNIKLKNGSKLMFWTYDQWQARLQWGSPDFTWLDEVPERWADFRELIRGTRNPMAQFLITFTPTNYNQKIYNWIFDKDDWEKDAEYGSGKKFVVQVDSLKNKKWDHSWMKGLSEEELQIVRYGKFVPPSGLVYKSFNRTNSVMKHFSPKELEGDIKYYGALDFWVKHPLAFLFIAVDSDRNVYIFDMIYAKNMLLKDLIIEVDKKKVEHWIQFEWIVADSADLRARIELKEMWMKTMSADKRSKGESQMSNRRTWIMKLNQMFALGEITVSDRCSPLITELETHHYKETWVDWAVEKTDDDALDALRYFIFNYRVKDELKEMKRKLRKKKRKTKKERR